MKSSIVVLLLALSVFGQGGRRPQAGAPASITGRVLDPTTGAVVTVEAGAAGVQMQRHEVGVMV